MKRGAAVSRIQEFVQLHRDAREIVCTIKWQPGFDHSAFLKVLNKELSRIVQGTDD